MNLAYHNNFKKRASKLIKKNPQLASRLSKQLSLLIKDQNHPSLRLHKLQGERSCQYAIRIEDDLRALLVKDKETWILVDFIKHY